ncbi:hypothetical protein AAHA92_21829 [Salvia divinorum]|uniref:Uncharacterized protein n=1 Tax=Salvia divinorum TaxID=28513 RepID=A0ABD1GM13_SALDI
MFSGGGGARWLGHDDEGYRPFMVGLDERIVERYNELKLLASYKRKKEQLRKHWDRVKKEISPSRHVRE